MRDVTRDKKHERQPPHIKAGKKPIWLTQVVFAWLEGKSSKSITIKIEFDFKPASVDARSAPPVLGTLGDDLMAASFSVRRV